jgi:DNA-binding response OmpR family regulator
MAMPATDVRRTVMRSEEAVSSLPRRALMVESEPGVRQLVRTHLELAGFALEEVADGRVALERLRAVPYDVIILDALAPNLDGLTLCRAARAGAESRWRHAL